MKKYRIDEIKDNLDYIRYEVRVNQPLFFGLIDNWKWVAYHNTSDWHTLRVIHSSFSYPFKESAEEALREWMRHGEDKEVKKTIKSIE